MANKQMSFGSIWIDEGLLRSNVFSSRMALVCNYPVGPLKQKLLSKELFLFHLAKEKGYAVVGSQNSLFTVLSVADGVP